MLFTAGVFCWSCVCYFNCCTHNGLMQKTLRAVNVLSIWLGLASCGVSLWEDSLTYAIAGGTLLVSPIIIVLAASSDPKFYYEVLGVTAKNESETYEFCVLQAKALREMKSSNRRGQYLGRALISQHLARCQANTCPITRIQEEFYGSHKETLAASIDMIALFIGKSYAKALETYPKSIRLRILYAEYLIRYLDSLPEAWGVITSMKELDKSFIEGFQVCFLTKTIKKLAANQRYEQDAIRMIAQQKKEEKFVAEIEQITELYKQFWSTLGIKTPDYNTLEEVGYEMLERGEKLEKIWALFKNQNALSANTLWVYSLYCEKIQTDMVRAEEIRETVQHRKIASNVSKFTYSADSPLLTVGGTLNDLGIIRKYNAAFSSVLGYTKNELINAPVTAIIPSVYQKAHETGIMDLYCGTEAGRPFNVRELTALVLAKTKYVIPLVLKMIELPTFSNNKSFIVALTVNKALLNYNLLHILLDENKQIVDVSSSCAAYIGLTHKYIRSTKVLITDIIREFEELEERKPVAINCQGRSMKCTWSRLVTSKKVFFGHQVQLELREEEPSITYLPDNPPLPDFQFSYSLKYNKHIGGINIDKSHLEVTNTLCTF